MRRMGVSLGEDGLRRYAEAYAVERRVARHRDAARESRCEAEAAARTRQAFLSGLNHELRTPLNHILGFAELLRDADQYNLCDDRRAEYIDLILGSAGDLLGQINDILEKAGYGQTVPRAPETSQIVPVVRRVLQEHTSSLFVGKVDVSDDVPLSSVSGRDLYRALQLVFSALGEDQRDRRAVGLQVTGKRGAPDIVLTLLSGDDRVDPSVFGAARTALIELGGRLDIDDRSGAGMRIIIGLPHQRMGEAA